MFDRTKLYTRVITVEQNYILGLFLLGIYEPSQSDECV